MTEKIISYNEIPKHARNVRPNEQVKVVLSKYQAFLYKQKIQMARHVVKKSVIGNAYETIKFAAILLAILVTCPKVAFLSDFHEASDEGRDCIEFRNHNDQVLVIFNSARKKGDAPL